MMMVKNEPGAEPIVPQFLLSAPSTSSTSPTPLSVDARPVAVPLVDAPVFAPPKAASTDDEEFSEFFKVIIDKIHSLPKTTQEIVKMEITRNTEDIASVLEEGVAEWRSAVEDEQAVLDARAAFGLLADIKEEPGAAE